MGYTTKFEGQFQLDRPLDPETAALLRELYDDKMDNLPSYRSSCCQWVLTLSLDGIRWDGGENFYDYEGWLDYIVENVLTPRGYTLTGQVQWQGEETKDQGILSVINGNVIAEKIDILEYHEAIKKAIQIATDPQKDTSQRLVGIVEVLKRAVPDQN